MLNNETRVYSMTNVGNEIETHEAEEIATVYGAESTVSIGARVVFRATKEIARIIEETLEGHGFL